MEWTLRSIAKATGGTVLARDGSAEDLVVERVAIDSRDLPRDALFVAIRAERDGHEFVASAFAAGARAVLVDARGAGLVPSEVAAVVVEDTTDALARLGRAARERMGRASVIGVTGSVGKTTTKDLLAAAAGSRRVVASERSLNNELGVPLTLLRCAEDTEVAVVELGARGAGHITALCEIAAPTIGIVTVVGDAHLGLFGDLDGVAAAKRELVESLPASGTAVLNADDARVHAMAARTPAAVLTFGAGGDVRATGVEIGDDLSVRFVIETPWGSAPVRPATRGRHNVGNVLSAAGAALAAGIELEAVADGLERSVGSPWRMEVHRTAAGGVVLNDAYNANPTSMLAALEALAHLPATRRVAVVGLMAELGEGEESAHLEIARAAASEGIELVAVGTSAYGVEPVPADRVAGVVGPVTPGTAVLVKGSRVSGLEHVADDLIG